MIGEQIGNYRVVRKLGEGGMGAVYEAIHDKLERRVAIKVLHPEVSKNPGVAARFFNEARAVNIIDHPGLVEVFEFGQRDNGAAYIIMEYLKGESLAGRLARQGGRLVEPEAVRLSRQVASALLAAHQKSIVHRDLKPDNVFIVPDPEAPGGERAKVLDFGIAKVAEELQGPSGEHVKTRTGILMGTPAYMSPEQCRGAGGVDARSDVYSLGVMMYQMLTGQLPFIAEGLGDLLIKHITEPPRPIGQLAPEASAELTALVHAMLAKTPAERLGMEQVVAELTRLGGGQSQVPFTRPEGVTSLPQVSLPPVSLPATPVPAAATGPSTLGQAAGQAAPPLQWTKSPPRAPRPPVLPWLVIGGLALAGAWNFWPRPGSTSREATPPPAMVAAVPGQREIAERVRRGVRQAQQAAQQLAQEEGLDLFAEAGAKEAITRFQERIGAPPRVYRLVLYRRYAILSAEVPGEPENLDEYTYRNGQVQDPKPVRSSGLILRGRLSDHLFPLSEFDPALVPTLAQTALDRMGIPDGTVTHMIIEWDRTFKKRKVIRVYVNGKRHSGMLITDLRGEVLDVHKS